MQNQNLPVLIFAQSGRLLAESATQSGYTVWVADCFGDKDTLAVSKRFTLLPSLSQTPTAELAQHIASLSQDDPCYLVCGSGIEHCVDVLQFLPPHIHYLGNRYETIQSVINPDCFFHMLDQNSISHPDVRFTIPTDKQDWLIKSPTGMGGTHITRLVVKNDKESSPHYFQQYLDGDSLSVLFLANSSSSAILSIHRQINREHEPFPFQLQRLESVDGKRDFLDELVSCIVTAFNLIGLNSLDLIVNQTGEIHVLEVNPRPSASMSLLGKSSPVFEWHCDSILNDEISESVAYNPRPRSLSYLYADNAYQVPMGMQWPQECADLPHDGQIINRGEPICSCLVDMGSTHSNRTWEVINESVTNQLIVLT